MKHLPIIVGAAAIGAVVVLADVGKKPGAANLGASNYFTNHNSVAGVTFAVPASAKMADTWSAMRKALGSRRLSLRELADVCSLWIKAWEAGCTAVSTGVLTDSSTAHDYSIWKAGAFPGGDIVKCAVVTCNADQAKPSDYTAIGKALCKLSQLRDGLYTRYQFGVVGAGEQQSVYDTVGALAAAMDGADYVRDGDRRSDHDALSLGDEIGNGISKITGGIGDALGSVLGGALLPIAAVAIAGVLIWKVTR